jgi:hypothetical protein
VADLDVVTRVHVLSALKEFDERGADDFLAAYGFGRAREYLLRYDSRVYDSKAIFGVAQKYATGTAASSTSFPQGMGGAARALRGLGFEVTYVDITKPDDAPANGEWQEVADVGGEVARAAWAESAREVLLDAASQYRAVVTYKELSTHVQYRTGIRTKQLTHYWIGDVLGRVSGDCSRRGEPLLSSLCVNADGSVGDGYSLAVTTVYGEAPTDGDAHAALERLECYRHFQAAGLPADGGSPTLVPKLAAARERVRKANLLEKPVVKCPKCNLQVPSSGICDYCD